MDYERYQYSDNKYTNDYNYQDGTYTSGHYSYHNNGKEKKEKSDILKKTVGIVAGGTLFGLCAGAVFFLITEFVHYDDGKLKLGQEPSEIAEEMPRNETIRTLDKQLTVTESTPAAAIVTDVTEVVDKVMPAVVSITNEFTEVTNFFGQNFANESQSSGSGIILGKNDEELLIVSNYHVIAEADTLMVQFINGKVSEAKVKGADSNMDLAVIAVPLDDLDAETKNVITIATMGDSDALQVGEPAIAIGNALGYGQSVTTGVISALDRQIEMAEDGSTSRKLIQTDAAINPGNSGGALLNVRGEVIGINSNKIGGGYVEGMGYAIPISSAEPIIENLMSKETREKVNEDQKGYLGITCINVTADVSKMYGIPRGVYVTGVYDNTAAENAGLISGDIIVGFDGSTLGCREDLQGYLQYYKVGDEVELTIMRSNSGVYEEQSVSVVLGPSFEIDN